ncbi:MAG: chorismate mutase [Streptococcus salivarius]
MDALNDIRIDIDNIDRQLIRLLAQRQILVEKAGRLEAKGDKVAVRANDRVAQVIANRRKEALELGLSPDVAESVWRSMIQAFIALEEKVNKEQ